MESSNGKSMLTKPILLKAGIPLVISLGGLIYTMLTTRRGPAPEVPPAETQVDLLETDDQEEFPDRESFHSLDSKSVHCKEEEEEEEEEVAEQQIIYTQLTNSFESLRIRDRHDLEEEVLSLKRWLVALQDRERELEMQFIHYCSLKEQESIIIELRNTLTTEIARLEFLTLEAKFIEAENQRLEAAAAEYLRIVEQLKSARLENGLLQRKVKKLLRKTREHCRVLRQQASALQSREAEILRNKKEMESNSQIIKELEEEIMELRRMQDQLQEEKKELMEKLELAESLASSTSKENLQETENGSHDQLSTELEQLQKDRAAEVEELIYLRWINACLRHELFRNQEQQRTHHGEEEVEEPLALELEGNEEKKDCGLEYDTDDSSTVSEHHESCLGKTSGSHPGSKKKQRLLQKLKRWVEGSEICKKVWDEKDKHQNKNRSRPSVSYEPIEQHPAARKSCSSV